MAEHPEWETQAEVDACASDLQVSNTQQARWRRAGLLPAVEQLPNVYRGSTVNYPGGYCAQLRALVSLKRQNSDFDYIGRRLWWAGYPVAEAYWRQGLQRSGVWLDRFLSIPARYLARPVREGVRAEHVPLNQLRGSLLTRLTRRVKLEDLPTLLQVLAEQGQAGVDDPFSGTPVNSDGENAGDLIVKALGLRDLEQIIIHDHSLHIDRQLPALWKQIGEALAMGHFADLAERPAAELEYARDVVRETLETGRASYAALKPVYPELAALFYVSDAILRYLTPEHAAIMLFGILRLHEGQYLRPLSEIVKFRESAQCAEQQVAIMQRLTAEHPDFAAVFTPRQIRASAVDRVAQAAFVEQVRRARLQIEARLINVGSPVGLLDAQSHEASSFSSSTALPHRSE